jgi:hypothetical protein
MLKYSLLIALFLAVGSASSFSQDKQKERAVETAVTKQSKVTVSEKLADQLKLPSFRAAVCVSDDGSRTCTCKTKCVKSRNDCRCED